MTATAYKPVGYGYGAQDAAYFEDLDKADRRTIDIERQRAEIVHDNQLFGEAMGEVNNQAEIDAAQADFLRAWNAADVMAMRKAEARLGELLNQAVDAYAEQRVDSGVSA